MQLPLHFPQQLMHRNLPLWVLVQAVNQRMHHCGRKGRRHSQSIPDHSHRHASPIHHDQLHPYCRMRPLKTPKLKYLLCRNRVLLSGHCWNCQCGLLPPQSNRSRHFSWRTEIIFWPDLFTVLDCPWLDLCHKCACGSFPNLCAFFRSQIYQVPKKSLLHFHHCLHPFNSHKLQVQTRHCNSAVQFLMFQIPTRANSKI